MALSELHKKIVGSLEENFRNQMTNQPAIEVGYVIIEEIDKEIEIARKQLDKFSSSEEYWLEQGKIIALKGFKRKFELTND